MQDVNRGNKHQVKQAWWRNERRVGHIKRGELCKITWNKSLREANASMKQGSNFELYLRAEERLSAEISTIMAF